MLSFNIELLHESQENKVLKPPQCYLSRVYVTMYYTFGPCASDLLTSDPFCLHASNLHASDLTSPGVKVGQLPGTVSWVLCSGYRSQCTHYVTLSHYASTVQYSFVQDENLTQYSLLASLAC